MPAPHRRGDSYCEASKMSAGFGNALILELAELPGLIITG